MECWVHHDTILDDDKAHQSLKEAWEHEDNKDELKIELQDLERQFWLGTEAGRLGCYNFPGETWREMGQRTKEEWVRAASVSSGRIYVFGEL
jgi:hypothetical protein